MRAKKSRTIPRQAQSPTLDERKEATLRDFAKTLRQTSVLASRFAAISDPKRAPRMPARTRLRLSRSISGILESIAHGIDLLGNAKAA